MLEFAGFLPFLLVIGMAAIQLGLAGYAANQAGSAARAAARAESLTPGTAQTAAAAATSSWLHPQAEPNGTDDTVTYTVTVHVPPVIPLFDGWNVHRTATMPNDRDNEGS
ncbi:TadE/TadG family type IV pilus assembly protein [Streptomyces sp. NPDC006422]|uniref:TadE/TadG family type IV pilus assembly protein n=1 Tax=unclassified Streptomyces TaxID=2593676 RepID=UPI0033BA25DF